MTFSNWIFKLKNEMSSAHPSFIPRAAIDYRDCIADVFNDRAEDAFSVLESVTHSGCERAVGCNGQPERVTARMSFASSVECMIFMARQA